MKGSRSTATNNLLEGTFLLLRGRLSALSFRITYTFCALSIFRLARRAQEDYRP